MPNYIGVVGPRSERLRSLHIGTVFASSYTKAACAIEAEPTRTVQAVRPGVTAIVVNWNGAEHLTDCLGSLKNQTYAPLHVLVVDNGSDDDSERVTRSLGADWLPLARNVGLAAAFNEGARVAHSELLMFLNNDMRFAADFVERMVGCLLRHPDCGAVDAVQQDWEDTVTVHASTRLVRGSLAERLPGWRFVTGDATADCLTVWSSGANTLIRADNLDRLGGWDPRFFAGYEDVDLGWRVWLSGQTVRVAADAVCWHRVGASSDSGAGTALRNSAAAHGPLLFALKHAPATIGYGAVVRSMAAAMPHPSAPRRIAARFHRRALVQLFRELSPAWSWRRHAYSAARTTARQHWHFMQQIGCADRTLDDEE